RRKLAADTVGTVVAHADHPIAVGRTGTGLERLDDGARLALRCPHAGLAVDGDQFHPFGHLEVDVRLAFKRHAHEILEHRSRKTAASRAMAEALRLVVAEIEADHEI